jgi:hypothetical protein
MIPDSGKELTTNRFEYCNMQIDTQLYCYFFSANHGVTWSDGCHTLWSTFCYLVIQHPTTSVHVFISLDAAVVESFSLNAGLKKLVKTFPYRDIQRNDLLVT